MEIKSKLDEVLEMTKINELLNKKEEEDKAPRRILWTLAIIGAIAAVAIIAYAVYRYLTPVYDDDFDDDWDDDYDFDDEPAPAKKTE
jgi:hypothetical protein